MTALEPVRSFDDVRTVDGRLPGRRGRATRERLLQCTTELLEESSYRDLAVSDIAQRAGVAPATFYQYFPDVESAILALAADLAEAGAGLSSLIAEENWRGSHAFASSLRVVDGFLELWARHNTVLRLVDLATAEGDMRFANVRTRLLNEITESLRVVIEGFKQQRRFPRTLDPLAQAATLVSMLAHVAAHRWGFEFWGIRIEQMRHSAAHVLCAGLTGRPASS